jgi:hypothetical protein
MTDSHVTVGIESCAHQLHIMQRKRLNVTGNNKSKIIINL